MADSEQFDKNGGFCRWLKRLFCSHEWDCNDLYWTRWCRKCDASELPGDGMP